MADSMLHRRYVDAWWVFLGRERGNVGRGTAELLGEELRVYQEGWVDLACATILACATVC